MTHVYACLLFTCYQYQGDVFTSFLSSVTITQCPDVMKVYPPCSILLKSHCSQHSELCSDPACSKYEVKAGARERGRTHECRMQIVAPESRPQAGADLATGQRKSSQCNAPRRPLLKPFSCWNFAKPRWQLYAVHYQHSAPQLYKWIFPALASHAAHAANTGAVYSYL